MGLRSAWTSLLVALMLCVSCAASTCATRCDLIGLQVAGPADHAAARQASAPDHCGHVAALQPESVVAGHALQAQGQCHPRLCSHDQPGALIGGVYEHNQQTVIVAESVRVLAVGAVSRLPNFGLSPLLPKPPPRYPDVLRL